MDAHYTRRYWSRVSNSDPEIFSWDDCVALVGHPDDRQEWQGSATKEKLVDPHAEPRTDAAHKHEVFGRHSGHQNRTERLIVDTVYSKNPFPGPRSPVERWMLQTIAIPERVVDAEAVTEYLGVSDRTVYRWTGERRIPSVRIGGVVQFRMSAIEECVRQHERGARAS